MAIKKSELVYLVDSREKKPYVFKESIVKKLDCADYSVLGWEDHFGIERKSLLDWVNSIMNHKDRKNRDRFEREIVRAKKQLMYFAIIIESTPGMVWKARLYGKGINRKSVLATMSMWSSKYNIPIILCQNRTYGRYWVKKTAEAFVKIHTDPSRKELCELVYGPQLGDLSCLENGDNNG